MDDELLQHAPAPATAHGAKPASAGRARHGSPKHQHASSNTTAATGDKHRFRSLMADQDPSAAPGPLRQAGWSVPPRSGLGPLAADEFPRGAQRASGSNLPVPGAASHPAAQHTSSTAWAAPRAPSSPSAAPEWAQQLVGRLWALEMQVATGGSGPAPASSAPGTFPGGPGGGLAPRRSHKHPHEPHPQQQLQQQDSTPSTASTASKAPSSRALVPSGSLRDLHEDEERKPSVAQARPMSAAASLVSSSAAAAATAAVPAAAPGQMPHVIITPHAKAGAKAASGTSSVLAAHQQQAQRGSGAGAGAGATQRGSASGAPASRPHAAPLDVSHSAVHLDPHSPLAQLLPTSPQATAAAAAAIAAQAAAAGVVASLTSHVQQLSDQVR